jgi:hypothetical protein
LVAANPYTRTDSIILGIQGKLIKNAQLDVQLSNLNKDWLQLNKKMLTPINIWLQKNNFDFYSSTKTVYYPFGGPDFLFAQTSFPLASRYILVGLENTGKLPEFNLKDATQWTSYIKSLNHSLRYLNKAGYFVTKQMEEDLKQPELEGVVNIFLLYLAKLNFTVSQIDYCSLNAKGELVSLGKKQSSIVRIKFNNGINNSELLYFKQNLANNALEKHPEFENYLSRQSKFHTYMKSASYILFDNNFSKHRDFILKNSIDIYQDDSGMPYKYLKNNFKVEELYGTYSQTTKSFKYGYQENLKKDVDENSFGELPFDVGYNQWINEGVLIYAHNDTSRNVKTEYKFGVQIAALSIPQTPKKIKSMGYVPIELKEDNLYKYLLGYYKDYKQCFDIKTRIQEEYPDAFIVVMKDNHRISLDEYLKH